MLLPRLQHHILQHQPQIIYTDPPTTHQGHFLPNNPMPYMTPSATHQPELLLLTWMLRTITSLVDDLQHHPIVHDPVPAMSSFTNTPAYRLLPTTPQCPSPLDQHNPRSPARAQRSSIPAWFPRLTRPLPHGPHRDLRTRTHQLPLWLYPIDHDSHPDTNRRPTFTADTSHSTAPPKGSIPIS